MGGSLRILHGDHVIVRINAWVMNKHYFKMVGICYFKIIQTQLLFNY